MEFTQRKGSNMKKRFICLALVMVMIFTLLPMSAFAENSNATTEPTMDVGGTTSVGKMISNEISVQKAETSQDESNISELVVEGDIATVTFMTNAAECDIVVGIYDENDETRMLASGTASAFSGVNKVSVGLSGEIPANFVATAYMLESTSHSPLCKAYTTQLYTTEMQAFLATTVSDYDEDLVLNLDESEETNFAVFNTDTIRADENGGMSVEDKGNGTYIVTNADAGVKSLAKGDEFAFTYDDGTVLLVSVATVNVDGDTVTLTEATDAELQDFFDYVKIEGTNDSSSQATIDTSVADEGVTLVEEQPAVQSRARAKSIDKDGSYGRSFSVSLKNDKIKGSLTLGYEVSLKVYIKSSYKFVMLKADFTQSLSATFTAFKGEKSLNLPSVDVYIMAGVYAHLKPSFVCEASVSVKWTGSVKTTIGIAYDSDYGFVDKSSSPSCDSKLELSGKIFVGIKVSLNMDFVSDKIASAGLEAKVGAELSEKERLDQASSGSKKHECEKCIEGKITFVKSLTGNVKFIKFEVERTFKENKWKLSEYYNSITFGDSGKGTCPHISYRVTAAVLDQDGNKVANASIECSKLSNCPLTDSNGVATFYLPNGEYTLDVKSGTQSASKKITIHNNEKIVIINLSTGSQAADEPQISDSGKCGDDLTWTLDSEGTLTISGTDAMYNYDYYNDDTYAPWYDQRSTVKKAVIKSGVTSIGDGAFADCTSLTSISIPNSVTSIGERAFSWCTNLTSISIPDSVTSIGVGAFAVCFSLTSISIPDSVTSIGVGAFAACFSLTSISIPDSVTSIGDEAFENCTSLTSISIPNSVTSIGDEAFADCTSLTDVYYSGTEEQWNKISIGSNNSELTNANIHFNSTAPASMAAEAFALTKKSASAFSAESINTEETGVKTSHFSDLQSGVQYVFIVVLDPEAEAYLESDNLCYIAQKQADTSGTLSFSYYSDAENAKESIHALHIHDYADGVCTVCGAKDPDYIPPVVKENPFVDVSESSVYYDAILWAYYHEPQQITGGYTATEFRPGNPCTRGQVVTLLWRAAGCPEPTGDTSMFKDASSIAAPYQKAVAWAVEKGITTGYNDGTFRPNDSVTRAQFVTFLWRYENRPATSGSIAGFTDAASIAEPYQQAVAWAVEKGITTGYNDGSFRPNATCTRWAVVLFMYRDMT